MLSCYHALYLFRARHSQQAASAVSTQFRDTFGQIAAANINLGGSQGSVGQFQTKAGLAVIWDFCEIV